MNIEYDTLFVLKEMGSSSFYYLICGRLRYVPLYCKTQITKIGEKRKFVIFSCKLCYRVVKFMLKQNIPKISNM